MAQAFDKLVAGLIKAGMTLLPRKRSYAAISFLISRQQGSWGIHRKTSLEEGVISLATDDAILYYFLNLPSTTAAFDSKTCSVCLSKTRLSSEIEPAKFADMTVRAYCISQHLRHWLCHALPLCFALGGQQVGKMIATMTFLPLGFDFMH